ncbi:MAG: hypothetical protein M3Q68_06805 [Actinomycetota bacterium]|nr:hypothetical protein [Actinomycetota bacterium]
MTTAPDPTTMCGCCGEQHPESAVHHLGFQPGAAICSGCAAWVAGQQNRACPVLPTEDLSASVRFWESAGFDVEIYGEDFAVAEGHGIELHLTGLGRSTRTGGGCYLHLRDVDAIRAAWSHAGLPVSDVTVQPWDMREFDVTDPGGNQIRVGQNV